MAEQFDGSEDRTEEATPERREDFRERGQIAVSREITSILVLAGSIVFLGIFGKWLITQMQYLFITQFQSIAKFRITQANFGQYVITTWRETLILVLPMFLVTAVVAAGSTLMQTRFNWSWKKMAPDFSRLNILKGLARMVSMSAAIELVKGVAKLAVVSAVSYLILRSEWLRVPELMRVSVHGVWSYWGEITTSLFWAVSATLLMVGGLDYLYNFISFERRMRMTKQEVKEEYKRRETDPHVKARMRRLQRDIVSRKMLEKTKQATVLITNPTHYAVAVRYELGMHAPIVVAKGVDFLALRMREVAKELDIPVVENKPLARTLYKIVEAGQEIPDALYKAVSEVIRYVFNLKGIRIQKSSEARK